MDLVQRGDLLCSGHCMREKKACCAHLCAVLMNKPEYKFRDFVEPWMTLAGHCKQLKLAWDDASLDGSQFPVPFLPDVEAMMGSDSLDRNVALAGKELKAVFGRVVGTAEEALKKRKRLADEVANGAKTGITTTESKDAAAGGVKRPRKCGPCTTRLGTPVLLIDCGGDRNGPLVYPLYSLPFATSLFQSFPQRICLRPSPSLPRLPLELGCQYCSFHCPVLLHAPATRVVAGIPSQSPPQISLLNPMFSYNLVACFVTALATRWYSSAQSLFSITICFITLLPTSHVRSAQPTAERVCCRHRMVLARAIYARQRQYSLDPPLRELAIKRTGVVWRPRGPKRMDALDPR